MLSEQSRRIQLCALLALEALTVLDERLVFKFPLQLLFKLAAPPPLRLLVVHNADPHRFSPHSRLF